MIEFHINWHFICLKHKHCQFEKKSTVRYIYIYIYIYTHTHTHRSPLLNSRVSSFDPWYQERSKFWWVSLIIFRYSPWPRPWLSLWDLLTEEQSFLVCNTLPTNLKERDSLYRWNCQLKCFPNGLFLEISRDFSNYKAVVTTLSIDLQVSLSLNQAEIERIKE